MKNHFFILSALFATRFVIALAPSEQSEPPPYEQAGQDDHAKVDKRMIIIGTWVIPDDLGYSSKVIAINTAKSSYLVRDISGKNRWYTLDRLGVTCGSLKGISVGDTVIPDNFATGQGKVVGINFTKSLYAVQGAEIYWYPFENITKYEPPASEKCDCSLM